MGIIAHLVAYDDLHAGSVHGLFAEFDGPDDGYGLIAAAGRGVEPRPHHALVESGHLRPGRGVAAGQAPDSSGRSPGAAEEFAVLIVDDSVLEKAHTDVNKLILKHLEHQ